MIRDEARAAVRDALKTAIVEKKPPIDELFGDVYAELPLSLIEQKESLKEHLKMYADKYDLSEFKGGNDFAK